MYIFQEMPWSPNGIMSIFQETLITTSPHRIMYSFQETLWPSHRIMYIFLWDTLHDHQTGYISFSGDTLITKQDYVYFSGDAPITKRDTGEAGHAWMSEEEELQHLSKAVLLHSLGNGAQERSKPHLLRHVVPNSGHHIWRRAALDALRHYNCHEVS